MIRLISFLIYFTLVGDLPAQGIEFFHGTWEEAKVKAQQEEKIIFVDAYASWCGPCKRMAKNVFTDKSVGDFYNQAYISLKLDMEKAEARDFRNEYSVTAYPTLFYLNEKGELLKRVVGGKSVDQFLGIGKEIAKSYDRSGDFAKLYEEGNREYDLVLKYIKALNNANKPSQKIANDFLRENTGLSDAQRAEFLYESMINADSRIFSLFIKDRSNIERVKSAEKVAEKIEDACWNTIRTAIDFESDALLSEAKEKMSKHLKSQAASFGYNADYEYAKARADIDLLNSAALDIAKKVAKQDPERLHDICNELLQYKSIDPLVSISSEKIAKMAAAKSDNPEYHFTYAKILSENNKSKKALKVAAKALEKTENPGDKKEIQEWIDNVNSK